MKEFLRSIYRALPFRREALTALRTFWRPPESIYRHLYFEGVFTITADDARFKMRHYGHVLENELFWEGLEHGHEHVSYSFWKQLVRDADVIFDIGANTGVYSLIARSLNPKASIFSFEPLEKVFKKLEDNCKLNDFDIVTVEAALTNRDGAAVIYDVDASHTYSASMNRKTVPTNCDLREYVVDAVRLDTFIKERALTRVDLMKVDVETHEPEVLEGMGDYVRSFKPTLLIEVLNDDCGARIEALVADCGYCYFNIDDRAGRIRPVEHIGKSDFWNFLLCEPETARRIGLSTL